jgi:hypothetical protein
VWRPVVVRSSTVVRCSRTSQKAAGTLDHFSKAAVMSRTVPEGEGGSGSPDTVGRNEVMQEMFFRACMDMQEKECGVDQCVPSFQVSKFHPHGFYPEVGRTKVLFLNHQAPLQVCWVLGGEVVAGEGGGGGMLETTYSPRSPLGPVGDEDGRQQQATLECRAFEEGLWCKEGGRVR